jgi:hypothetical protein
MKKIFLHILILLFSINNISFSQLYENITPASPTAAGLGTYGETPVSLYAGTPTINIPLYQLKGVELSMPISLSYNASGIRVEENSSWVGLGWSLEAGGVITRNVRSKTDNETTATGMIPFRSALPLLTNNLANINSTWQQINNYTSGTSGNYDFEPDIFNYNFMGMTGSFVFDNLGKPQFSNYANYKVTLNATGFILITDNGTKFEFANTEQTNSVITAWYLTKVTSPSGKEIITLTYSSEPYFYYPSIKYSKTVRPGPSPFSDPLISFSSTVKSVDNRLPSLVSIYATRLNQITFTGLGTITFVPATNPRVDVGYSGTLNLPKALAEIQIKDFNNLPIKSYSFEYDNVETSDLYPGPTPPASGGNTSFCATCPALGSQTNHLNFRMYLKKVSEKSGIDVDALPPYEFQYAGRDPVTGKDGLPHKMSGAQDHWGFYNHAYNGMDLLPGFCGPFGYADNPFPLSTFCSVNGVTTLNLFVFGGSDREPNADYIETGTLKQIKYPTGGTSSYIYEPHRYVYIGNDNIPTTNIPNCPFSPIGGGLRIKEVVSSTPESIAKSTQYVYEEGTLKSKPRYYTYFFDTDGKKNYVYQDCTNAITGSDQFIYVGINTGSVNDQGYRGSANVGYGKVTEKNYTIQPNGTREYNGCSIYQFNTEHSDPSDASATDDVSLTYFFNASGGAITSVDGQYVVIANTTIGSDNIYPFYPGQNLDWRHGQLLNKTIKNNANQTVSEQQNIYTNTVLSYIPASKVFPSRQNKDAYFLNYNFLTGWPKLTTQIDKIYDINGASEIISEKAFEYSSTNHKYMTKESSINSDGTTFSTETKYIEDYDNTAMSGNIGVLKGKNILSTSIDVRQNRRGLTTQGTITELNSDAQPISVYKLEILNPITIPFSALSIIPTVPGFTVNPYTKKTAITYFNKRPQTITKQGNDVTTYLWGYNDFSLLAEIKNGTTAAVTTALTASSLNFGSFSTNYVESSLITQLNTLRDNLSTSLVTSYTYLPSIGVSTVTSPNKLAMRYLYDKFERLEVIKDNNQKIVKSYQYNFKNQ